MPAEIGERPHIDYALVASHTKCKYHVPQFPLVHPTRVPVPLFGVRHLQVLLLFCMVFLALGSNVSLSVAIVAMTDSLASSNPKVPVSTSG